MSFAPALLRLVGQAHRLRIVLAVVLVAAVLWIGWRGTTLWQEELTSMSPVSVADQRIDRDLRSATGAPDVRYIVVATAPDMETVLQAAEQASAELTRLVASNALSGFDSPDRYLPSRQTQAARRAALPDPATLRTSLFHAADGLPFRPDQFAPFLDDVERVRSGQDLTRASLEGPALSLKLDSLLVRRPDLWAAILPLRDVADPQAIAAGVSQSGRGQTKLLDLKAASDQLLDQYRFEAQSLALLGLLVIAGLLAASFRSVTQALSVLAPLVAAVILTVALLILGGHRLSIFNLFGLLLVVAVGSNYCLFFQRGLAAGEEGERTVSSLLLANICTVLGFGVLSLSGIPVLFGIGGTVAIGTALSLVAGAILMPRRDR